MATNDFLPFATNGGANVDSQAAYAANPNVPLGQQPGVASSSFNNKALRQASVLASQLAQLTSDRLNANILDNGSTSTVYAQLNLAFPSIGIQTATKTSTYAILTTDSFISFNASGGNFTTTLPTAVGASGKIYTLKRLDQTLGNLVTIATTSAQTIDGATTKTLSTQYELYMFVSDGSNWQIMDHQYPSTWTSYTLSITGSSSNPAKNGTPTVDAAFWRRIGDSLELRYNYYQSSSGTAGSGTYLFSLPSGLTIDSTKSTAATAITSSPSSVGYGSAYSQTTGNGIGSAADIFVYNSTNIGMLLQVVTTTGQTSVNNTTPVFIGTASPYDLSRAIQGFKMFATLPITNWGG